MYGEKCFKKRTDQIKTKKDLIRKDLTYNPNAIAQNKLTILEFNEYLSQGLTIKHTKDKY